MGDFETANDTLCKTAPRPIRVSIPTSSCGHHCFTEVTGLASEAGFLLRFHGRAELRSEIPVSAKIDKARRVLALIAAQDFLHGGFRERFALIALSHLPI